MNELNTKIPTSGYKQKNGKGGIAYYYYYGQVGYYHFLIAWS